MKHRIVPIILLAVIVFLFGFFLRLGNYNLSSPDKNLYYDDNGVQYFQESDSYYNYRLTGNLLEHGHLGDKIVDGKPWDLHSYYPPGVPVDYPPLLAYITIGFYFLLDLVTSMSLREVCLWLPVILGPLAGVVGFLFSRRISNDFGGFLTGMLIVTTPLYASRTTFGFFDTDMLNITFPLVIVWFLFEAEKAKSKKRIIFSVFAGFLVFLFSLTWDGWLYYFYIIFIASIVYLKIRQEDYKKLSFLILPFFMTSIILIGIFRIFAFYKIFMTPITYINLLHSNPWYPWPDSYKNVAELQTPTVKTFITAISPLSLMGFIGVATILYHKHVKITPMIKIILTLWIFSATLLSLKGTRFILLLIGPLSIFAGIFWKDFEETIKSKLKRTFKNKIITICKVSILLLILLECVVYFNSAREFNPMYDDYFDEAAQWIKNNTSDDTVIITDWSYGHFFTSESQRPVLFDGRLAYIETLPVRKSWYGSSLDPEIPTTARNYWINLAFTTDNPTLSKNIFKMLATSGDNAYLLLNNYTKNKKRSFIILQKILELNRTSAYIFLKKNGFSDEKAEKILNYTHPINPRPFILIITSNMENRLNRIDFVKILENKKIKIYRLK
ncbi:MAG: peptide transporter [Methanobacteriaceae archaeon]|nr:peptide transporter [Methanobacteriaceae archaeon]